MLAPRPIYFLALAALGLTLASAASVCAQTSASRHFETGNERYRDGAYEAALEAYQKARATGHESVPLYFNMGNAAYRLDRLGAARRYYERARRLHPGNERVLHNIEQLEHRTADQFTELPNPFWTRWWGQLLHWIDARGLFLIGMAWYVLALGLLCYRLLTGTPNRWRRAAMSTAFGVALLCFAAAFAASADVGRSTQAVVMEPKVTLREQPEAASSSVSSLHEGTLLDVLRTDSAWTQVRLPNGQTGWMPSDALAEV